MKVGGNEIVSVQHFIAFAGEEVETAVDVYGWHVVVKFVLQPDAERQQIRVDGIGNQAVVTLEKFTSPLGTSLTEPLQLAMLSDGRRLLLALTHRSFGDERAPWPPAALMVQFMVGPAK